MLLAMATKRRTRHEDNDSVQDTELVDLTLIDVSAQIALPIFLILAYTAGNTNTQAPLQPILTERSFVAVVAITAAVIIVALVLLFIASQTARHTAKPTDALLPSCEALGVSLKITGPNLPGLNPSVSAL